ncbi:YcxB family protein [Streptomyces sporangiiformans]|uniref:YcxB family protein n=1 Tax=Streptomyces sporangiiformans TaxID=2315329 RepID=A0A505D579_9ACTN|nr:YcxB family protein [Streptomyces sporangiiformans]
MRRGVQEQAEAVEPAYRPTRADILAGIRVRERLRRLVLLRWAFVALFAALAVQSVVLSGWTSSVPVAVLCAIMIWSIPHLQAHHVLRTVGWQGEYRTTVSGAGVAAETEHTQLLQRWSLFRGYRETPEHLVLLSRDPNILVLEVLPKRGAAGPVDVDRLWAILDGHLTRV